MTSVHLRSAVLVVLAATSPLPQLLAQEVTIGLYGGALIPTKHLREIRQPGIYQYQQTLAAPTLAARVAVGLVGPVSLEVLGGTSSANHKTHVDFFTDPNFETDGNVQFAAVRLLATLLRSGRTRPTVSVGLGVTRRHFEFVGGPGEATSTAEGLSASVGVTQLLGPVIALRLSAEFFSYSPDNMTFTPSPGVQATVTDPRQFDVGLLLGLDLRFRH